MDDVLARIRQFLGGADPLSLWRELQYRNNGQILVGMIVEYMPHVCVYTVSVGNRMSFQAVVAHPTSALCSYFGAVDISSLMPGTSVLVYKPDVGPVAYIIGALPDAVDTGHLVIPDALVQAGMVGLVDDEIYAQILRKDKSAGLENYSAGRVLDQLQGDWGAINELGMAVMLGKFMAMMRVSDDCGVWLSFFDKLLRLSARNLEQFTASTEHRVFDDEGEVHDLFFGSKYPWEAMGLSAPGDAFTEARGEWKQGNQQSYYEPIQPDQTGAWRYLRMRGYLGDYQREMIILPPNVPVEYQSRAERPYPLGLLEVVYGSDGRYSVRSAKEIILRKYIALPVPRQAANPDHNDRGDNHTNYKASGLLGDGPTPPPQDEFDWGADDLSRGGLLPEYLAQMFNWYKQQSIQRHERDWRLASEADSLPGDLTGTVYASDGGLDRLRNAQHAELPRFTDIRVDHRAEQVRFYQSQAGLSVLDDGTVILDDGYGSQLEMSRGNIKLTCAGDIQLMPGRHLVSWVPGDTMMRSGRHVELTSSSRDVRIKAERNLHLLGGNSGEYQGGILLESRSRQRKYDYEEPGERVESSGIVMKTSADVVMWAGGDLVIGIKQVDGSSPGKIIMDADNGNADIYRKVRREFTEIGDYSVQQFQDRVNIYERTATRLTGEVDVAGSLMVVEYEGAGGYMIAQNNVAAGGRLLAGDGTPGIVPDGVNTGWEGALMEHGGAVLPSTDPAAQLLVSRTPDGYTDQLTSVVEAVAARKQSSDDEVERIHQEFYEADEGLGNDDLVKVVGFSLRTDEQYDVYDDFKLYQHTWQGFYRREGGGLTWKEQPVDVPGSSVETYPHPGKRAWTDDQRLLTPADKYRDADTGLAGDRDGYQSGPPESPVTETFEDGYLILVDLQEE